MKQPYIKMRTKVIAIESGDHLLVATSTVDINGKPGPFDVKADKNLF